LGVFCFLPQCSASRASQHSGGEDFDVIQWFIVFIRWRKTHASHHLHARVHTTKNRVLPCTRQTHMSVSPQLLPDYTQAMKVRTI
jgi:hypothetical protein